MSTGSIELACPGSAMNSTVRRLTSSDTTDGKTRYPFLQKSIICWSSRVASQSYFLIAGLPPLAVS